MLVIRLSFEDFYVQYIGTYLRCGRLILLSFCICAGTGLPPVIFAKSPNYNISKQTICVYGHVDVQPAKKEDGWIADPFVLTEVMLLHFALTVAFE